MRSVVPRLIHRLWRSPFPEGEGFGAYLWAVLKNQSPESTEQELPLGEAGSPVGEPDEGRGAAYNILETAGESVETSPRCHSDRSVSGAEESTTWQEVPT